VLGGWHGWISDKTDPAGSFAQEIDRAVTQSGSRRNCSEAPPHSEISEAEWNVRELLERLEGDQDFLRELLQMSVPTVKRH